MVQLGVRVVCPKLSELRVGSVNQRRWGAQCGPTAHRLNKAPSFSGLEQRAKVRQLDLNKGAVGLKKVWRSPKANKIKRFKS